MQTQTAKMIYPNEAVAAQICEKLTETKGKHVVMKVPTGFQVCPVTICKGAVSPNKATPYPDPAEMAEKLKTMAESQPKKTPVNLVGEKITVQAPFVKETSQCLVVTNLAGKTISLYKTASLASYEIDGGTATMVMTEKVAKQKGFA